MKQSDKRGQARNKSNERWRGKSLGATRTSRAGALLLWPMMRVPETGGHGWFVVAQACTARNHPTPSEKIGLSLK